MLTRAPSPLLLLVSLAAAASGDAGQAGEPKKADPRRQLVFQVKGLT
jgi:hypothetical protein